MGGCRRPRFYSEFGRAAQGAAGVDGTVQHVSSAAASKPEIRVPAIPRLASSRFSVSSGCRLSWNRTQSRIQATYRVAKDSEIAPQKSERLLSSAVSFQNFSAHTHVSPHERCPIETARKSVESYRRYGKQWFTIPIIKCDGPYPVDLLAAIHLAHHYSVHLQDGGHNASR